MSSLAKGLRPGKSPCGVGREKAHTEKKRMRKREREGDGERERERQSAQNVWII